MLENFYGFLMTLAQDIENPVLKACCEAALKRLTWEEAEMFFPGTLSAIYVITTGAVKTSWKDYEKMDYIQHCMVSFRDETIRRSRCY